MTLTRQLSEAFFHAPKSILLIRSKTFQWLFVYLLAGLAIFSLFTWQLLENEQNLKNLLLDYFFPTSWHEISEQLAMFLYDSQAKTVVANAIMSGSLVLASMFLFPIKEQYSAVFERESGLSDGSEREFPLMIQAWEEVKLFLFYLTAQSIILWIGYYPYSWASWLSIILSYLFLFYTFGIDFISPTLQRHRVGYTLMLKALFKRPWVTLGFGVLFSLPIIGIAQFAMRFEELTLVELTGILFIANIFFLTLAVPAGTRIACSLMGEVKNTRPPRQKNKVIAYSCMLITLTFMLFLHGGLVTSLHHKSQLLKAQYDVDWDSFDFDLPNFSQLLNGKALSKMSFNVEIKNPTEFDIVIENSEIWVEKKEKVIAQIDLAGFEIPAGQTRQVKIKLDSNSDLGKITNFREILEHWRVDLHLELWPGIPFIVNIAE
ncbi:hypothetical protein [Aliikangiella sp. G2MR2-5]|uniref:hypothetical protein n=1 Tax=Aliikangiella sp. G2MR2-5 TaxID=2788943 RepID=UPI0018A982CA|nr:hypothetical protein [Aliikangiella sp. G2MR2-5]